MSRGSTHTCPLCCALAANEVWREGTWRLVRCTDCSLVYLANPPSPQELALLYSFKSGFHTELANQAEAIAAADDAASQHLNMMGLTKSAGTLLDVGCSTGRFIAAANQAGFLAQGVEFNVDTAELARAQGLDVTTGTLSDLKAPKHFFDAITMWDIVEHVPDPLTLLNTARELLAEDGWLWLTTPNIDGLFPQASLRVAHSIGKWPHPEPPYHLTQFSQQTITAALHRAGFDQVVVKQQSIPLSYSFGSALKVLTDPRRLAYAAAFAPLAVLGPLIGRGDTLLVAARPTVHAESINLREQHSEASPSETTATRSLEKLDIPSRSLQR